MRLYRFDAAVGYPIGQFDSRNVIIFGILRMSGESHETSTEVGLVALVIEGEMLDPASFMPEQ
jgi:hypothetical protein